VLRDAATGKERFAPLRGLPTIIVGLAFGPGSDRLVSAGVRQGAEHKGELTLWDARTGRVLDTRPERDLAVLGVAFSRDGRYVAAGYGVDRDGMGGAGRVRVWEMSTDALRLIATLEDPDHPGPIYGVAFDPDGRIAAAGVGRVRIWDVKGAAWSPGRVLPGHTGIVFAVAFCPDGKQLATAGWDRATRLWDPNTGREVRALYGHTGFVRCLAYAPDGRRLATGSEDRSILLWDTTTGRPVATYRGHQAFVMALAFHPDGRRLTSGGTDRLVKTWDLAGGQPLAFREHDGWVTSLDFSSDGARVVSGGRHDATGGSVRVWDAATGRRLQSYEEHLAPVVDVRFRPDGRHVVSASVDATVRVWDATTGRVVAPPVVVRTPPPAANACGAIRPDGREIAVGATDGTIRLWDMDTGRVRRTLTKHTGTVVGLAYDRDGLRLASTSALGPSRNDARPGGELKLWDVASGRELATPRRGIGVFRRLAFSPDGHRLVLADGGSFADSGEAYVWDVETGRELFPLRGHTTNVHQATFSPDGTRIATASMDRTVKLWDAASGEEVFTLRGHTAGVFSVAFSPDGHRLASGGIDWTARVWDARPPDDEPRSPPP
jgi:WD40 repeat protein